MSSHTVPTRPCTYSPTMRCRTNGVRYPPARMTVSFSKTANTPDRMRIESSRSRPVRPVVKDRRYSTIWNRASGWRGRPTLTTRPFRMVQPLAMATCPPTATTRGSSWMTRIISLSAR